MNNSECTQLDIDEVEEFSLGPEHADVDMKKILRKASRGGRNIFKVVSKVKEEGEHLVAGKWRWDDWQRPRKSKEEKARKESRGLEEEDKRKRCAAFEEGPKEC